MELIAMIFILGFRCVTGELEKTCFIPATCTSPTSKYTTTEWMQVDPSAHGCKANAEIGRDVGVKGEIGPVGPKGEVGPVGFKGEIGPIGEKGELGTAGPNGEIGPVGPKGENGTKGDTGSIDNSTIKMIQNDTSALQQNIKNLEKIVGDFIECHSDLQNQVDELKIDAAQLKSENQEMNNTIKAQQNEITRLAASVQEYEEKIKKSKEVTAVDDATPVAAVATTSIQTTSAISTVKVTRTKSEETTEAPTTSLINTTVGATTTPSGCDVRYGGKCFRLPRNLSSDSTRYAAGEQLCTDSGWKVANIYSSDHYDAIATYIRNNIPDGSTWSTVWLAVTRNQSNGDVSLSTGAEAPSVQWHQDYPQNDSSYTGVYIVINVNPSSLNAGLANRARTTSRDGILCEL